MAKKFRDLVAQLPEERQQKIREGTQALLAEMALQDLRKARELSQETLAEALRIKQSGISKLEQRDDIHVSTLRRYIEALGGTLDIRARFPDGDVRINLEQVGNGRNGRKLVSK